MGKKIKWCYLGRFDKLPEHYKQLIHKDTQIDTRNIRNLNNEELSFKSRNNQEILMPRWPSWLGHRLGKAEVAGSNPARGSNSKNLRFPESPFWTAIFKAFSQIRLIFKPFSRAAFQTHGSIRMLMTFFTACLSLRIVNTGSRYLSSASGFFRGESWIVDRSGGDFVLCYEWSWDCCFAGGKFSIYTCVIVAECLLGLALVFWKIFENDMWADDRSWMEVGT